MTVQTFRDLLSHRPFQPFRLVMSSGEAYEVRHPELAMLTRTDILVGLEPDEENVPARFKICSLLHVTTDDPESLLATLVAAGLLTPYQAGRAAAGTTDDLVVGNYRLLGRLGVGGLGTVYLAEHLLLRRPVALKLLNRAAAERRPWRLTW